MNKQKHKLFRRHLAHAMSASEKHDYNINYYRTHSQYWVDYRNGITSGKTPSSYGSVASALEDAAKTIVSGAEQGGSDAASKQAAKILSDQVNSTFTEAINSIDTDENRDAIASRTADAAIDIGKRAAKKIAARASESLRSAWELGAAELDAGARAINSMWKDGASQIKSEFMSLKKKFGF